MLLYTGMLWDKLSFLSRTYTYHIELYAWLHWITWIYTTKHVLLAATKQLYEWYFLSVCPSVRLSVCHTCLTMFPSSHHHAIFRSFYQWTRKDPCKRSRSRGQRSMSQRSQPNLTVSGQQLQLEFTYDVEMMHIASCCLEEVPYCFSRSSVKFQSHAALKIVEFDPDLAFPDCISRLIIKVVIHQIWRSHGSKNRRIWPKLGVSGL